MRKRILHMLTPLALAALVGSPASATMVAGWDFSQWFGDGLASTDGATFQNTLDANYSDLDPSFGAGPDSGDFGTLYFDGSNGSSSVALGGADFAPSAALGGSLAANTTAPAITDFESLTVTASEGQLFNSDLAMIAGAGPVSVVFQADLGSVGQEGSGWSLTFAARTFSGTATVTVEFSTDGVSWGTGQVLNLNTVDSQFDVALGPDTSQVAYARLTFDTAGGNPLIDQVAFNAANLAAVPEPSVALLGAVGLIGLAIAGRKRAS